MSGARRYISASERSRHLCEGVAILGRRNHAEIGSPAYEQADAEFDRWRRQWPELVNKASELQSDAFAFCTNL